ncbi:hypothetical protein HAX54_004060 [Datura stramonium]|uniref:TF-B3 domain-containing protein n=1 Tax=Datura stramonium TaxID=4076 RepID=A0ABS8T7M4_DATST|nr:hypothetical protein [Datura stramonium]
MVKQEVMTMVQENRIPPAAENEMDLPHDPNVVVIQLLCETDKSHSVLIPNKFAEDHLPPVAPGKSKMLEFEDSFRGNNFRMEFVHSNFGDYYLRTGWERYRDEHKLECGDFISFYKKIEDQNGSQDLSQYSYVIHCWKLPKKDEAVDKDAELDATLQLPNESIEIVPVLSKNLCYEDLYGNPKGLRLPKKEVEENFRDLLHPDVGGETIIPLFDSIGKKHIFIQLVHTEQEGYYITGSGWEEYVAEHNLLIFDTIFINKVTLDPSAEVQLVGISYFYEITFQTRATKPHKKPKLLGKTMESAPASTTTAGNNSSAPASTATAGNNSSAPASTATAGNNSSAPASTTTGDNKQQGY